MADNEFTSPPTKNEDHVVIEDALDLGLLTGAIIEDRQRIALEPKGLLTLPVIRAALPISGLSGWNKRFFGGGLSMHHPTPRHFAQVGIHAQPMTGGIHGQTFIHWAAEVVSGDPNVPLDELGAHMNLAAFPQPMFGSATLGDVHLRAFDRAVKREDGSWILRGCTAVNVMHHGPLMLGLYGMFPFARCRWIAVSQGWCP